MKKYLVIADTYRRAYGCEYTLFGIFDTREEAIKWIIEHPVHCMEQPDYDNGYDGEFFDFFEGYVEGKGAVRYGRRNEPVTYTPMTKEEYIGGRRRSFIHEFTGEPMFIGGYQE